MTNTWQPITVPLSSLKPWERNPKTISKSHAKRLLANWNDLGQWQTIAIGPAGEVYDGHQRLSVLKAAYGSDYKVQALQSARALTDDERGRIVFEGTSGAVGQIDWEVAASFDPAALLNWGMDAETLSGWKRDTAALDNFLKSETPEPADAEPQIDRAAELNEKWQVKTGDLFRIGEHRLLCGDSTVRADVERVMDGERADLWFADPPYNAGVDEWDKEFIWAHDYCLDFAKVGIVTPGISAIVDFSKITNMPYKWSIAAYISNGFARSAVGFGWWVHGMLFSEESIFKQKPDAIEITLVNGDADGEHHRGQKPPKFMNWIISLYGDSIVLDTFGGSGTAIVTCQNLQRKCRAIEISPNYCAVILERMSAAFPGIEIERI